MNFIKNQINLFLTAVGFFTRIPCRYRFSQEGLNQCNRYFPLIGAIVGASGGLVFWLTTGILSESLAIFLSMVATILITGAFHEDGFTDVCDGFGGGWNKQQILTIMKDSRIGAYGVIGIIMLFLIKYLSLYQQPSHMIIAVMIVGHTLSRSITTITMFSLEYVRDDETSKVKPIAKSISKTDLAISVITGLASVALLQSLWYFMVVFPLILFLVLIHRWFKKWIGGYTGDCLGAVQQLSEVIIYLSILIIIKHLHQLLAFKNMVLSMF